jgi:hypothetical protein
MPLSSLGAYSYSTPNGRFKDRRAAIRTMMAVGAGASSVRLPPESPNNPAAFEASTAAVNNVAYVYKPMADLLGLIAGSGAGAFPGGVDVPRAPDYLGDLSWLFATGASDAAAATSAGPGLAPSSSVLAANAAYESSMDLADEEAGSVSSRQ